MLFFGKDKTDKKDKKTEPQQRSTARKILRFAFNPEIGDSIRPIRETNTAFINILAMIFISQGMFPADHPAYLSINGARLTLYELMFTTWRNLKFTKESVPQVLMFFMLLVGLGFAALAFIAIIGSILGAVFIHRAHADSGYFTSSAGDSIALSWIRFFRDGDTSGGFFSFAEPLMMNGGVQQALISALGFYSDAILIIAAAVLFYHLAAMTVETAHHGVVMGKNANQIWAPIRLVVAVGLLVPIGGGLNSGQYIVFKISEWGSGLADNLWEIFLGGFADSVGVASIPEYSCDVVYNTFMTEVSKNAYDSYDHGGKGATTPNDDQAGNGGTTSQPSGGRIPSEIPNTGRPTALNSRSFGGDSQNQSAEGGSSTAQAVQQTGPACFDSMKQEVAAIAKDHSCPYIDDDVGGCKSQGEKQNDGALDQACGEYMSCLAGGLPVPSLAGVFGQSAAWGWLSAGALLSAISQAEADANDLGALIPNTQGPDEGAEGDAATKSEVSEVNKKTRDLEAETPQGGGGGGGGGLGSDKCAGVRGMLMQAATDMKYQPASSSHFLDRVFMAIDWLAQWNCVWVSLPPPLDLVGGNLSIGIMFIGANPLAEMAKLGQACINTAYDAFDIMVNLSSTVASGAQEGKAKSGGRSPSVAGIIGVSADQLQGAVTTINGILAMITSAFFTAGVLLAYYVPLIPFIAFLFGVMQWVLGLLEAVICAPLLAVAHLTVQGEGLPGKMAQQGYFFLLNLGLRPALMVFGLVSGYLVFLCAVSYMNMFYDMAISTAGGIGSSHVVLSRIIYNGIYVIIIYVCANSSFKAISWLPEHAIKWMGAQPMAFAHMGDPKEVAGPLLQGAGNISQVTSALNSGGPGGAKALGGGGGMDGKGGGMGKLMGDAHGGGKQITKGGGGGGG